LISTTVVVLFAIGELIRYYWVVLYLYFLLFRIIIFCYIKISDGGKRRQVEIENQKNKVVLKNKINRGGEGGKILIITVNYNNSLLTVDLSENIYKTFDSYDFYIVDNDSDEYNKSLLKNIKTGTVIFNDKNCGYFQGINIVLERIDVDIYAKVIICNNDILFDETFYSVLIKSKYHENVYAISPRIYDMDGIDQNPMIKSKVSKFKIFFYDIYFMNYYLGRSLYITWQFIKNIFKEEKISNVSGKIFMGYGAIYILTVSFFNKNRILDHPPFLMGEEAFLASQINKTGGVIYYDKDLIVFHKDHSSCSKIPTKKLYYITKQSYKKYRDMILCLPEVK
jgi:GT2 family glycosyltransferase